MVTPDRRIIAQHGTRILEGARRALASAGKLAHLEAELLLLVRRVTLGLTLLGLSALLGISAREQSRNQGRLEMEDTHPPSATLWKLILMAQGYEEVRSASIDHALARTHPGRWDRPGEVWVSELAQPNLPQAELPAWVSVLPPLEAGSPADILLFHRKDCGPGRAPLEGVPIARNRKDRRRGTPREVRLEETARSPSPLPLAQAWRPLGKGWTALASWSERYKDSKPTPACASAAEAGPSESLKEAGLAGKLDSRSLRY